jgi:hypothetical protein
MSPLLLAAALLAEGEVVGRQAQSLLVVVLHPLQLVIELLPLVPLGGLLVGN